MKISVIVPVYNVESYLEECIESILNQTHSDFEVLLINDGSTDGCKKICDSYSAKDRRIQVFHQSNQGVSKARNVGLDHAKGDYIVFIDSDDSICRYMFEILLKDLVKYKVDISCCVFFNVKQVIRNKKTEVHVLDVKEAIKKFLMEEICPGNINKLFSRSLIGNTRFNENITHGEDFLFNWEILKKTRKISLNEKGLYYVNYRAESASHKFSSTRLTEIKSRDIVCEEISKMYPELVIWVNLHYLRMLINILYTIAENGNYKDKKYFYEVQRHLRLNKKKYISNKLFNYKDVCKRCFYLQNPSISFFFHKILIKPKNYFIRIVKNVLRKIYMESMENNYKKP